MAVLPRVVFSGDREIAVRVLRLIKHRGVNPLALLLPDEARATHADDLWWLCHGLGRKYYLHGAEFRSEAGIRLLKELAPDYIICVHFPYIFPPEVLSVPKQGVLNLHPAYLPWNRGWHTPTWAIWEGTPYGATLHFMSEEVDAGDIIHQKKVRILPDDTADSLYKRVMKLEYEVFKEAWPSIADGTFTRKPQDLSAGTFHRKEDIKTIQRLDLDEVSKAEDVIRRLRALTTNDIEEAAYFEVNGIRRRVQIKFPDKED
jgi:methionyl-tRNA formyltransferase